MRPIVALTAVLVLAGCSHNCTLKVESIPPGAEIVLDGVATGYQTPRLLTDVYSGLHIIRLLRGRIFAADTVWPPADETTSVSAFLPAALWTNDFIWDAKLAVAPGGRVYATALAGYSLGVRLRAIDPDGTTAWMREFSDGQWTAPAIGDDGTVYFATEKRVLALHPDSTTAWEYEFATKATPSGIALGADGTAYVGSGAQLFCFGPDGVVRWRGTLGAAALTPPAIGADGTICIGNANGVFAFHPDGAERWYCELETVSGYGHGECGIAVADDGAIYVTRRSAITAVSSSGTRLWSRTAAGPNRSSVPVIGDDGTVFATVGSGLCAFSADGSLRWTNDEAGSTACPAADDGGTVIAPAGSLMRLRSDGSIDWRIHADAGQWFSPTFSEGLLYANANGMMCAFSAELRPAASSWPQYQHDARRTGRYGAR